MRAKRKRILVFTVGLGIAIVGTIALGAVLLTTDTKLQPPAVTISAADRRASPELIRAAAAVGFLPTHQAGVGELEKRPAEAAKPAGNPNLLPVGAQAPGFVLKTPTGERVSLRDFRGKATLVEFFATWCPHCNAEAAHLRALHASLAKPKYAFVAINADGETAPSVFAFHVWWGLGFPALLDPSHVAGNFHHPGRGGPVSASYRVLYFPTFYVLDPRGRIFWRSDGEQPDALLRQQLLRAARA
jgi:peroxiredoxin